MNKAAAMREGGLHLGKVRQKLYEFTKVGVSPWDIEQKARELIQKVGAEPSFIKVPKYHWATCININESIVHGIPESKKPLEDGDMMTVDVGIYLHGFHTDCAFTKVVGHETPEQVRFLEGGLRALSDSIQAVKPGNRIGDISSATEAALREYGYYCTKELPGHGVGRELHEEPMIPNYAPVDSQTTPQIIVGQTLAIEIIYCSRPPHLYLEEDGWTIAARNDKLTAVFEETVMVTPDGFSIITEPSLFQIVPSGTIQDSHKP